MIYSGGGDHDGEEETLVRIVKNIEPPTGLPRLLFRLPIPAYRLHLGWLFGRRLLLLNHTGRVTGQPRQAVLEVADHDAADGSYVVASGWGTGAAWYRCRGSASRTCAQHRAIGTGSCPGNRLTK